MATTLDEAAVLLETGDVALHLRLSAARVRQLAGAGVLRFVATTPRGARLYDLADVLRLAETRRVRAATSWRRRAFTPAGRATSG